MGIPEPPALATPILLTSGIEIRPFQVDFKIFTDASTQGCGAQMGESQISERHRSMVEV